MATGRVALVVVVLAGCGGLSGARDDGNGSADGGSSNGARGGSAGSAGSGAESPGGSAAGGAGGTITAGSGNASGGAGGGMAGACNDESCVTSFIEITDFDTPGWPPALLIAGSVEDDEPYVVSLEPPRDESHFALHLDEPEELGGADVGFHQHFAMWAPAAEGLGEPYVGIRFWAKRGENGPDTLLVAITGLAQERSDYVTDLEAGRPWLIAGFVLTTTWRRHFALFRDFRAGGDGEPAPASDAGGQVLHFIVPKGEPIDVWLDDIELACAGESC
jgi:hypothetical protein